MIPSLLKLVPTQAPLPVQAATQVWAGLQTGVAPPQSEFARQATASMVGVNIGVAAPMSYFPFGGSKESFFGDVKAHGRDGVIFYTEQKVVIERWF